MFSNNWLISRNTDFQDSKRRLGSSVKAPRLAVTEVSEDCDIKSCMSVPDFKLTEWWTMALMDVYYWKLADGLSPPPTG